MNLKSFLASWLWAGALLVVDATHGGEAIGADEAPRPNILFCIADDASWPHFGAYGCRWVKTPAIDRLAQAGLLFENAYTPTAKCAPSRSAILTGRNPWQLEEAANHMCDFPAKFPTFAEALDNHGYVVGQTGKGWGPGVSQTADGRPRNLLVRTYRPDRPKDYASAFRKFLAERPRDKPFFFWFGSTEPHRAYEQGSGMAQGGKKLADIDHVPTFWPDNDTVRGDMLDYALEIEQFDAQVNAVLEALEQAGELENTLIVVTSDNGMPFPRSKGHTYDISNHMPMVMTWPHGIKNPGRAVTDLVSFIDLAPTFLELAGVDARQVGMAPPSGHSLTDILRDLPQRTHTSVLVGRERNDWGRPQLQGYPVRGLIQDGFLYLINFEPERWPGCDPEADYPDTDPSPTKTLVAGGRDHPTLHAYWTLCFGKRPAEELYNLAQDRDCVKNLVSDVASADRKKGMRQRLLDLLKAQQDPRVVPGERGVPFDQYLPTRQDWIGKYEREVLPRKR
jgi:arylsulfatase A-like enzyme